mmetsp:Transcript_101631/g.322806  ORF Transcript_101631/g.322806 Transcript_101631/m.322806 type:complete len:695 (+) Transcript_101631:597-2681(+)
MSWFAARKYANSARGRTLHLALRRLRLVHGRPEVGRGRQVRIGLHAHSGQGGQYLVPGVRDHQRRLRRVHDAGDQVLDLRRRGALRVHHYLEAPGAPAAEVPQHGLRLRPGQEEDVRRGDVRLLVEGAAAPVVAPVHLQQEPDRLDPLLRGGRGAEGPLSDPDDRPPAEGAGRPLGSAAGGGARGHGNAHGCDCWPVRRGHQRLVDRSRGGVAARVHPRPRGRNVGIPRPAGGPGGGDRLLRHGGHGRPVHAAPRRQRVRVDGRRRGGRVRVRQHERRRGRRLVLHDPGQARPRAALVEARAGEWRAAVAPPGAEPRGPHGPEHGRGLVVGDRGPPLPGGSGPRRRRQAQVVALLRGGRQPPPLTRIRGEAPRGGSEQSARRRRLRQHRLHRGTQARGGRRRRRAQPRGGHRGAQHRGERRRRGSRLLRGRRRRSGELHRSEQRSAGGRVGGTGLRRAAAPLPRGLSVRGRAQRGLRQPAVELQLGESRPSRSCLCRARAQGGDGLNVVTGNSEQGRPRPGLRRHEPGLRRRGEDRRGLVSRQDRRHGGPPHVSRRLDAPRRRRRRGPQGRRAHRGGGRQGLPERGGGDRRGPPGRLQRVCAVSEKLRGGGHVQRSCRRRLQDLHGVSRGPAPRGCRSQAAEVQHRRSCDDDRAAPMQRRGSLPHDHCHARKVQRFPAAYGTEAVCRPCGRGAA